MFAIGATIWAFCKPVFEFIGSVISFLARIIIPIPLLAIIIVAGIWYFERDHAMVKYAENQIKQLVAGAELEQLKHDLELNKKINKRWSEIHAEEKQRADEAERANREFEAEQMKSSGTIEKLHALLEKANAENAEAGEGNTDTISDDFFNSVRDK